MFVGERRQRASTTAGERGGRHQRDPRAASAARPSTAAAAERGQHDAVERTESEREADGGAEDGARLRASRRDARRATRGRASRASAAGKWFMALASIAMTNGDNNVSAAARRATRSIARVRRERVDGGGQRRGQERRHEPRRRRAASPSASNAGCTGGYWPNHPWAVMGAKRMPKCASDAGGGATQSPESRRPRLEVLHPPVDERRHAPEATARPSTVASSIASAPRPPRIASRAATAPQAAGVRSGETPAAARSPPSTRQAQRHQRPDGERACPEPHA